MTFKQDPFLLYDSAQTWYADGTFKADPEYLFQLDTIHGEKDSFVFPSVYALCKIKVNVPIIYFLENRRRQ